MSIEKASETWDMLEPFAQRWLGNMLAGQKSGNSGQEGYFIILYDESGLVKREYSFSSDGLTAALAAAESGDVVWMPAGTITPGGTGYEVDSEIDTGAVTVTSATGSEITGLTIGELYAIESTGGPHYNNPPTNTANYDYNLNLNGTWGGRLGYNANDGEGGIGMKLELPPGGSLAEAVDALHARCYFEAAQTSIRMRIEDQAGAGTFGDNTGSLSWKLSTATTTAALTIPSGVELVGIGRNSVINGDVINSGKITNLTITGTVSGTVSGTGEYIYYNSSGHLVTNKQIRSLLATGTSPLYVASTTMNENLNADLLDGYHAIDLLSADVIEYADDAIDNPPNQDEISSIFGAPSTVGAGYVGFIDDGGSGTKTYMCVSDGTYWHINPFARGAAGTGLWYDDLTRYGVVLEALTGEEDYVVEPSIMVESGVWKMWYRYGGWSGTPGIAYATSTDGINWTRDTGNNPLLENYYCPFVFKDGDTYHLYATSSDWSQFDHYTSADGISWTLAQAAVLEVGSGTWDGSALGNMFVWKEDTNDWRMLYEAKGSSGVWKIGYATSSDGDSWSKSASNPFIDETGSRGGPFIYQYGSTYYLWCHGSATGVLPTDLYRYHSDDLTTWVSDGLQLERSGADEGEGSSVGQVADPHIAIHRGIMYLFYEGSPNGSTGAGQTNIKLVTGKESLIWE